MQEAHAPPARTCSVCASRSAAPPSSWTWPRRRTACALDTNASYGISSRKPENFFNSLYASWSFGVSFTLPVFDGFKRSGLVWQATANQRAARLEREKVEQQVRLGLQQGAGRDQGRRRDHRRGAGQYRAGRKSALA